MGKYSCKLKNELFEIDVYTDNKVECDWIIDYLSPYCHYQSSKKINSQYFLFSIYDPLKYSTITKYLKSYKYDLIKDHHFLQCKKYEFLEQNTTYFCKKNLIIIRKEKIFHVVKNTSGYDLIFESARIIREILTFELLKQGFYKLHCSAVEKEGLSIVFCGNKGSGKTTRMINMIQNGFNFITNDRAFIGKDLNGNFIIWGWPGAVSISVDTLSLFDNLKDILNHKNKYRFPQWRLFKEKGEYTGKFDLMPMEFANLFSVRIKTGIPVKKIICLSDENQHISTTDILTTNLLFPSDDSYPDWIGLSSELKVNNDSFLTDLNPILQPYFINKNNLENDFENIMKIFYTD